MNDLRDLSRSICQLLNEQYEVDNVDSTNLEKTIYAMTFKLREFQGNLYEDQNDFIPLITMMIQQLSSMRRYVVNATETKEKSEALRLELDSKISSELIQGKQHQSQQHKEIVRQKAIISDLNLKMDQMRRGIKVLEQNKNQNGDTVVAGFVTLRRDYSRVLEERQHLLEQIGKRDLKMMEIRKNLRELKKEVRAQSSLQITTPRPPPLSMSNVNEPDDDALKSSSDPESDRYAEDRRQEWVENIAKEQKVYLRKNKKKNKMIKELKLQNTDLQSKLQKIRTSGNALIPIPGSTVLGILVMLFVATWTVLWIQYPDSVERIASGYWNTMNRAVDQYVIGCGDERGLSKVITQQQTEMNEQSEHIHLLRERMERLIANNQQLERDLFVQNSHSKGTNQEYAYIEGLKKELQIERGRVKEMREEINAMIKQRNDRKELISKLRLEIHSLQKDVESVWSMNPSELCHLLISDSQMTQLKELESARNGNIRSKSDGEELKRELVGEFEKFTFDDEPIEAMNVGGSWILRVGQVAFGILCAFVGNLACQMTQI